jgi:hypothetical protein
MRVLLAMLATAALAFFGFQMPAETTEYHGGDGKAAQTTVTFSVRIKGYHSLDVAATALWQTCTGNIGWDDISPPVRQSDGTYVAALRPSITSDTKRRLRGCLNESTLDRVQGKVIGTVDGPATTTMAR